VSLRCLARSAPPPQLLSLPTRRSSDLRFNGLRIGRAKAHVAQDEGDRGKLLGKGDKLLRRDGWVVEDVAIHRKPKSLGALHQLGHGPARKGEAVAEGG